MSRRYKKKTAENAFIKYRKYLQQVIAELKKNFGQMDFESADARDRMEEHITEMIQYCQSLIDEMEGYNFL